MKQASKALSFKVHISNAGQDLTCRSDETLLEAALRAGIDFPFACASGNCASCISQLEQGQVVLLPHADSALSAEFEAAGKTLPCRARPCSDVKLTWLARQTA